MLKTKWFEKNGNLFIVEKILTYVFSHYRVCQTPRDNFRGSPKYSYNYCGSDKIDSVTPKSLLKTSFLKRTESLAKKNYFGVFFLVLLKMRKVREQPLRLQKVFWQYLCKLIDLFFRTSLIVKQIFQNKCYRHVERDFGQLLLILPTMADIE